jgi:1-acyl-sn-glycerol-3-phosphate acyltransferase
LNYRLYKTVRALATPLTHLYFRIDISGQANLPDPGTPCIVTVNHSSTLDVFVIGYAMGRPGYFAAKAEVTQYPIIGPALTRMGALPARRDRRDTDVVRLLKAALESGGLTGLAPEGTRSLDGRLAPFDPGFVWLASKTDALVVPSAIHGARDLMPKGKLVPRPGRMWVKFGDPMKIGGDGQRLGRDELEEAAEAVRQRTIQLLTDMAAESGVPDPATIDLA